LDNPNLVDILDMSNSLPTNPDCTVSAFITPAKMWDIEKLRVVLNNDPIVNKIVGIPIPIFGQEDTCCWGFTGSGTFSTRSATWATHKSWDQNEPVWAFKWISQLNTMPKIKIFLWQMLHNALPLRGVLLNRGMVIDPACPLCTQDIEMNDHLFWECPSIKEV